MKLYSYSSDLLTLVEVKWTAAKIIGGGILIGTIFLLGLVMLNQSVGNGLESRSTKTLTGENNVLRRQLNFLSPRVNKLEIQVGQLSERANELHKLLPRRKSVRDTVLIFTNAIETSRLHSLMAAAKSPRP
jgi:hypothetical protein